MTLDADKMFETAIRDALREGIKAKMTGYNSDLDKLVSASIAKHDGTIRGLLEESIGSCVNDPTFRDDIKQSVRHTMAKLLVQKFGGELEKQINTLKSDPLTRARIVLALDEIVKQKA